MPPIDFDAAFAALTGHPPFPWQRALYDRFLEVRTDNIPAACNLPTGLGKTSVIAVWLLALATNATAVPRRLVYVVNRRTVVDQTTNEVEKLRANLSTVPDVAARLQALCAIPPPTSAPQPPLAISTLRGQFADNREWSGDPSRPAVVCGTVDMIGSRLLFSGYGCGFKTRPLHAGFLGYDALVVHDEAHLEPAFQKLLLAIEDEQKRERTGLADRLRLRVMALTATPRGATDVFELTPEEKRGDIAEVQKRVGAKKSVHLIPGRDAKKLAEEIADLAATFKDSKRAVLVFVRKVDDVDKIVGKLRKDGQAVQQLTGTLRGLERDRMADPRKPDGCPIFARFLKPPPADAPESERWKVKLDTERAAYLVCTSAGEVGVNISADHLVCDLSTFESMAQRFGRVNRFGDRDDTEIRVVHPTAFDPADKLAPAFQKTLTLLTELKGDGSPAALNRLDPAERLAAFAPTPTMLDTSDILFDAWALTSVKGKLPGRPPVEPYLHGKAEWEPPETHVGWRDEVGEIVDDLLKVYPPADLLEDYPLKPHELLRDNSARVYDRLKKFKAAATKPETPVWLLADDETVTVTTLGRVIEDGKEELYGVSVLLAPDAGGLANGFLASDSPDANDVSDQWLNEDGERRRVRVWDAAAPPPGMRRIRTIDINPDADEVEGESTVRRFWKWYELPAGGDGEGSKNGNRPVTWEVHTGDVVRNTRGIVAKLTLPDEIGKAIIVAAELHDFGKKRKHFQRVLGNTNPARLLAKSGKRGGRVAEKYRHEFGSLLDADAVAGFAALSDGMKDLVLHLIATHHGRGRPHFPADEAFDPELAPGRTEKAVEAVAAAVPRRYARLQRAYGRWGLAYLESLLRAADYAASARPSEYAEDRP